MIILVDLDNTVADFNGLSQEKLLEEFGLHAEKADCRTFYFADSFCEKTRSTHKTLRSRPGFYAEFAVLPGAREAILEMDRLGHEVFFCTSPSLSNPTCASDKFQWVMRIFGKSWGDRLIITKDKTMVRGDILIDDKPEITGSRIPTWEHVYLDQNHNQPKYGACPHRRRITWQNWSEVLGL